MEKRNRIEISGFLYKDKKVAESKASEVIITREKKIADAKKEWLQALKTVEEAESGLKKEEKKLEDFRKQFETEEDKEKLASGSDPLEKIIIEKQGNFVKAKEAAEAERLIKVNKIRKINIKAYQLKAVECIGKRGGNWIFISKN